MSDKLTDILSSDQEDFNKEQMLKYLNGELSADEQHELEKAMIDSEMMSDAMEGLQSFGRPKDIPRIEKNINSNLQKYLKKKKGIREKRKIRDLPWLYIFIIIILLLIIISFVIIKANLV